MAALVWDFSPVVEQTKFLTRKMAEELRARGPEGAMSVGISVLGNVSAAYRAKARKEPSEDGIVWKDLARKTLEARVRRRAAARQIVSQRRALAAEIRAIRLGRAPKSANGKTASPKAAIARLTKRRAELSARLQSLVDHESSAYEIGVDTGLQINSASPGFSQQDTTAAPDESGFGEVVLNAGTITIGYDRTYSAAFDAVRPLMPETLPDPWKAEAETALATWAELIIQSGLN